MPNVLETIQTTDIPISNVITTEVKRGKVRSEASINRFLVKNKGYEFVNGKLEKKKMPTAKHSGIATRLSAEIYIYLKTHNIGRVYGDNTIYQIGENKRIPDASFVSAKRIPPTGEPIDIWSFAPDLAIEVISPSETHNKVERKIREYFDAGVTQVWKIVPEFKTLTIYFSPTETKILTEKDELTCEEILPKFRLALNEIFVD